MCLIPLLQRTSINSTLAPSCSKFLPNQIPCNVWQVEFQGSSLLSLFLLHLSDTSSFTSLTWCLSLHLFLPQYLLICPEKHITVQLEQKNIDNRIRYLIYTYNCLYDQSMYLIRYTNNQEKLSLSKVGCPLLTGITCLEMYPEKVVQIQEAVHHRCESQ